MWLRNIVTVFLLAGALHAQQTTTTLNTPANMVVLGQPVTLTANVVPVAATGRVTFYDGIMVLGTRTLTAGQATLTTSLLCAGSHALKAYYTGGGTFIPSKSAAMALTVTAQPASGFRSQGSIAADNGSRAIAVADFNGDGKADLAVLNAATVSVLIGNGDGTVGAAATYSVEAPPPFEQGGTVSMVVADFNNDGKTDIAAMVFAPHGSSFISFLTGNGDGTFQPASFLGVLPSSVSLTAGDFNSDGNVDLAFFGSSGMLEILLGNGDGTFRATSSYNTGVSATAVAADFNGDGIADLVFPASNALGLYIGNGDGTFRATSPAVVGLAPTTPLVVGDFNGDGKADVAFPNAAASSVTVLIGKGDGTFQAPLNYGAGTLGSTSAIMSGDLNGDGNIDIAVINSGANIVSVLPGNGDGTFLGPVSVNIPGTGQIASLAVADVSGDGRTDFAFANSNGTISVLLGKPSLTGAKMPGSRVGVFRANVAFLEDSNGNTAYDPGVDRFIANFAGTGGFMSGDIPVTGDWTGDGNTKVGIYRSSTGTWFLDANNNGIFDAGDYQYQFGGIPGDTPFAGDWNGLGKSCIGLYRSVGSVWLLDLNCNGAFENAPNDAFFPFGGVSGDVPVAGAWTGGTTRVGVVRKYAPAGVPQGNPFFWVLDGSAANAGSGAASHQPGFAFAFGGLAGDVFVTGDWYANGTSVAAVYRAGFWVLDAAPPSAVQAMHVPGLTFGYGGVAGDLPVVGKW